MFRKIRDAYCHIVTLCLKGIFAFLEGTVSYLDGLFSGTFEGTMLVRLYSIDEYGDEQCAFVGKGTADLRMTGSEMLVEQVSVDISDGQRLPTITRATVALEDFPDLEVEPEIFEDIYDLNGPVTLHLVGVGDAPLVVVSRA